MCGIFGAIGHSKNPKVSYEILTELFKQTEDRGKDASGFWMAQADSKDAEGKVIPGKIAWDKAPMKSSQYVATRNIWKNEVSTLNPVILIGHCRLPNKMGDEKINQNNHPHVSDDGSIGLVHNGKIPEYNSLKTEYITDSGCDSEVLLRMFEHSDKDHKEFDFQKDENDNTDPYVAYRLSGIKDIYAKVNYGAMAVAIGEYVQGGIRHLWLFRDNDRPLHLIDLRDALGQVFFCSTDTIWEKTMQSLPDDIKEILPTSIIVSPPFYVWNLIVNSENNIISYNKFSMKRSTNAVQDTKSAKKDKKEGAPLTEIITEITETTVPETKKIDVSDTSTDFIVPEDIITNQDSIDSDNEIDMDLVGYNVDERTANVVTGDTDQDSTDANPINKTEYLEMINIMESNLGLADDSLMKITTGEAEEQDFDDAIRHLQEVQKELKKLDASLGA